MSFLLLPDDLWLQILSEWLDDAVDWTSWSATCRHAWRRLPRPRPLQFVTSEVRYPHVVFAEEAIVPTSDEVDNDEPPHRYRLLCRKLAEDDEEEEEDGCLLNRICREGHRYHLFTYVRDHGEASRLKAYLEPSYYNSAFRCEQSSRPVRDFRSVDGYGLVYQFAAPKVLARYDAGYRQSGDYNCYWQVARRCPTTEPEEQEDANSWMQLRYGDASSSMLLDLDAFFKALLLISDEAAVWMSYRLEDYSSHLPFYLSREPPFWHAQWRTRLWWAIPTQPRPLICHAYQTNVFAPCSWEDDDDDDDDAVDDDSDIPVATGARTAHLRCTLSLRDSHVILHAPPLSFCLRLPLPVDDYGVFSSLDPGAWLRHWYECGSRRWFVARKYWRVAADVREMGRPFTAEDASTTWPVLHPDHTYQVIDQDLTVVLPNVPLAIGVRGDTLQEEESSQGVWQIVLHG